MEIERFTVKWVKRSERVWRAIYPEVVTIRNGDLMLGSLCLEDGELIEDVEIYRKGTWIPMSVPPPFDEKELVTIKLPSGTITTMATYRAIDGCIGWYYDDNPYAIENFAITHWQPLPSPAVME